MEGQQELRGRFCRDRCGVGGVCCRGAAQRGPGNAGSAAGGGGEDKNRWIHIPLGFGKTFADPSVNRCYETEPDPGAADRKVFGRAEKVLGGSSSINGMGLISAARPRIPPPSAPAWQHRLVVRRRASLFQALRAPDAGCRCLRWHRRPALRFRCARPSPHLRGVYRRRHVAWASRATTIPTWRRRGWCRLSPADHEERQTTPRPPSVICARR